MMEGSNVEQIPAAAGSTGGNDNKKEGRTVMDTVCDPCGLVPDNLEEALAHKKKMKLLKDEETAAANAQAVVETPEGEKTDNDPDEPVSSIFNIDCCGKAPTASEEVEVKEFPAEQIPKDEENPQENPDEQIVKNTESASVMTGNNSFHSRSLAEIAAKMEDIDLETAAEDTAGDQISDDGGSSVKKFGDVQVWYKQPLYAFLIFLCGSFSIAIFVMAILLIVNRN